MEVCIAKFIVSGINKKIEKDIRDFALAIFVKIGSSITVFQINELGIATINFVAAPFCIFFFDYTKCLIRKKGTIHLSSFHVPALRHLT